MRTRTTLTTSPGESPSSDSGSGPPGEHWYPAFALPSEPSLPSRLRPLLITLAILAVVVTALYTSWRITQRGTDFDPALNRDTGADAVSLATFER